MSEIFEMPTIHPGLSSQEVEFREYVHKYINKHYSKGVKQSSLMKDGYLSVVYKVLSDSDEEKIFKLSSSTLDLYLERAVLDLYKSKGSPAPDIYSIKRFKTPHGHGALTTMQFINSLNLSELNEKGSLQFDDTHGIKMADLLLSFHKIGNTKILGLPIRNYADVSQNLPRPIPKKYRQRLSELISAFQRRVADRERVIHGDFKESNVLMLDGDKYLLIDPNPKYGDPLSDIAFYLLRSLATSSDRQPHLNSFLQRYLHITRRETKDLNEVLVLEATRLTHKWYEMAKPEFPQFYQLMLDAFKNYEKSPESIKWLTNKIFKI